MTVGGEPARRFARGADGRAEGQHGNLTLAPALAPVFSGIEALHFLGALVDLRDVNPGAAGRQSSLVMRQTLGHPFTAGRARQRHRRHRIGRDGVALEFLAGRDAVDAALQHLRPLGDGVDDRRGLAERLVGQYDHRKLQRFRDIDRVFGGVGAVGHRYRRQHDARRVAVRAVDRQIDVALFGLRGDAGGRSGAHHVDQHHRNFRRDRKAERLDHQ